MHQLTMFSTQYKYYCIRLCAFLHCITWMICFVAYWIVFIFSVAAWILFVYQLNTVYCKHYGALCSSSIMYSNEVPHHPDWHLSISPTQSHTYKNLQVLTHLGPAIFLFCSPFSCNNKGPRIFMFELFKFRCLNLFLINWNSCLCLLCLTERWRNQILGSRVLQDWSTKQENPLSLEPRDKSGWEWGVLGWLWLSCGSSRS
jgi:hypothetical protein